MHDARIELHDTICVGQSTVSNAGILRVEFDNVHARNDRIENVGTGRHHLESLRDAREAVFIFRLIPISRRNHDRSHATG
jgi:hypothetical protein